MLVSKKNLELLKHSYKSIRIVMNKGYHSTNTLSKKSKSSQYYLQNSSNNNLTSGSIVGLQKLNNSIKHVHEINLKFYLILVTDELSKNFFFFLNFIIFNL